MELKTHYIKIIMRASVGMFGVLARIDEANNVTFRLILHCLEGYSLTAALCFKHLDLLS